MKALLVLLLLSARTAFTVARSLNAARPQRVDRRASGVGWWRPPLLERTHPFVLIGGQRRSLVEALQDGHPERLHCGLEVRGQLLLLDLEKNRNLLPKAPNVFFYLPNGTGVSITDDPVTHCYYHGNVRGFPRSRVALSTCSGLRGVIAINATLSFELQPIEPRPFQQGMAREGGEREGDHLLYSTGHVEGVAAGGCGVSAGPAAPPPQHSNVGRSKRDILSETKYIELVLVVDHQEFVNYQKNNKTIVYRMLDVANQVDWFYRPLNVRVALTGLEIWSDRDKIPVEKNPIDTLNNFLEWRARELLPRLRHDNAQLIMGSALDGTTVGMASQSSMCSRDRSGGVNVDHLVSVLGVASTVAHEVGHNLGMSHDTIERHCSCLNDARLGGCIMEPSTGFMPGQQFSSCSAADLSVSLLHGGGMCLFNVPQPDHLVGEPRCGNLYVERGEECDCGLLEECQDPCCNASTCRLLPGAQCSSDSGCCQDCKLRAAGSVCREPIGECDLPEFCTGSSPYCPPNVFLQNGEPCEDGGSYCYGGVCASMRAQCQALWGPNASSAPAVCFSSVNKQGNKFGNCGQLSNGSYAPCGPADVHCGRIQCQSGRERPLLGTNAEILTTTVRFNHSDLVCRGTFFHLGDDVSDPASVAEGTACGRGKACLDHKCQDASIFGVDKCRRKCNGHGVCNSNNNCHCQEGWAPPDCMYAGHGGSVDSGPTHTATGSDPVRVALLVIFLFILPVVLLFLALRFSCVRRLLSCLGSNKLVSKSAQHSRTPATEREDDTNGEQVRPLRYHVSASTDSPEAAPLKQLTKHHPAPPGKPLPPTPPNRGIQLLASRPASPNKPLPPDPVSPGQVPVPPKPALPKKPLVLLPLSHLTPPGTNAKPARHSAAFANRRRPLPVTRPIVPPRLHAPPLPPHPAASRGVVPCSDLHGIF
ncbi:disintegrin and metalloproteinase domain-containing protein 12 isoform X1 [Dunckerocampus dactyliophorus]|uniref:disintegrin and metalloproteinase domain-containing protein 12 isoform X1 n=1 Tax=Dunckerocampus dactyliophorus TaxID=161453 RepID=UPI002406D20D|nr:disintegrin and metalloproteinase domain-containing protein 12 isoform X1 [Dunckerocampus dactyliophorus]